MTVIEFQIGNLPAMHALSHFTEGQAKQGSVKSHDLIKESEKKKSGDHRKAEAWGVG